MNKTLNQRAWFMVLPVLALVAMNAIIPLMTVVNYSVQEVFYGVYAFVGERWYADTLASDRFHAALGRQFLFTFTILAIEIPLGVIIALSMPRSGVWASVCLVLMALPLLIPWNVVGAMWNIFALPDIGLLGFSLNWLGMDYDYTQQPLNAWFTVVLMDVWHWTSLAVLLAYAGLQSIDENYYRAARIDGASGWAVFRYIQLPKMKRVLTIAILLRFMDSFMIVRRQSFPECLCGLVTEALVRFLCTALEITNDEAGRAIGFGGEHSIRPCDGPVESIIGTGDPGSF